MDSENMVINRSGATLDYQSVVIYMDGILFDTLAERYEDTDISLQDFFSKYEELHIQEFGEEWECSKAVPDFTKLAKED